MSVASEIIPLRKHAAQAALRRAEVMALFCVTPALLLMLLTTLVPFAAVLMFSLTNYELGAVHFDWIGLGNFAKAMTDPEVANAVRNTFLFAAIVVPGSVGLGLFFALLVNARTRTRRFYEIFFFLPITATSAVIAIVWNFILQERIGPVAALLKMFHLSVPGFLSSPSLVIPTLALVGIWQQLCFCFIIFLAGLTTIPKELYEAAALDGAEQGWEKFRRITWPQLAPTTLVVVLLTTLHALRVFDLVVVMTKGGPGGRSEVILYKTYLEAFSYFRIGYGSALTLIFVAMMSAVTILQFLFAKSRRAA